ncbi:hypothetical protein ACPOL_5564 [Acidisarcina polymorpha]|uniref:Uncharacterized protein n=1 Tax=Acidisarcina polymorpha TaxID=2211140 RepID=A0A2Z5G6E7_9BACT|nr:hypothetical protein [Acidisarcina polymorpha]AXC14812.1 hypothetical protein ACPOL_5564 [Acidisarcina polymorpha]
MMILGYEGWFQCRFATDPDPTDDPRGVSGPTFSVPGEPPLDQIIRLGDYVFPRFPRRQSDGVTVRSVTIGQTPQASHPLLNASVRLLDDPRFQQRNMIIAPLNPPFQTPIDPFRIQISGGGITITRQDCIDLVHPELTYKDVFLNTQLIQRRQNQVAIQSVAVAEKTGFMNYWEVRAQRKADLERMLKSEKDPIAIAALKKRIMAIENDRFLIGEKLAATQFMGMQCSYGFSINGGSQIVDPDNSLQGTIGRSQAWPVTFWMGGFDVDTMFGYFSGSLTLPFYPMAT